MKPKYYIFDPNENKWFALFDLDQALAAYVLYSCNDARYTIEVPDYQQFKFELERRKLMITDAFRFVVDDHEDYQLDFKMPIKDRDLALFNSLVTVLYTVIEIKYGKSNNNLSINENNNFDLKIKPLPDGDLSIYPTILFQNIPYIGFLINYFFRVEGECECI